MRKYYSEAVPTNVLMLNATECIPIHTTAHGISEDAFLKRISEHIGPREAAIAKGMLKASMPALSAACNSRFIIPRGNRYCIVELLCRDMSSRKPIGVEVITGGTRTKQKGKNAKRRK